MRSGSYCDVAEGQSEFLIAILARASNKPCSSLHHNGLAPFAMSRCKQKKDRHPVWLSIGPGCGLKLRIESEVDADTFLELAFASAGSRLLQELIGTASAIGLAALQPSCLQHVVLLTKHRHGNFVVTKLKHESPPWFCIGQCRAFAGKVCELSRHRCGSRVLERIIEHHGHGQVDFFFAELVKHAPSIGSHTPQALWVTNMATTLSNICWKMVHSIGEDVAWF